MTLSRLGAWQFARITEDQTEALFGEADVELPSPPSVEEIEWVEGWEAGLYLMDRFPWAMLHPVAVHPEFMERVRAAIEARWAQKRAHSQVERVRGRWTRVLGDEKS